MTGIDPAVDRAAAGPELCRYGCYWECEHRAPEAVEADGLAMAGALLPVHDDEGRALGRCRDCGGMFYALMDHAREHERLRQLGLLAPADVLAEAAQARRSQSQGDASGTSIEAG